MAKKIDTTKLTTELIELGQFYFVSQKFDEAIKEFKKALHISPNNAELYYNLGITYEALNDYKQAKRMFARTIEINEDHKLAKKHLEKLK